MTGLYAVCTDLLDDEVGDILKVSEGRWQIEECFRIMKNRFFCKGRSIYGKRTGSGAHFPDLFPGIDHLPLILRKKLDLKYTL